jgi:hypothetical protein
LSTGSFNQNQIGNGQRFFGNCESRIFFEPGEFLFNVPPGISRVRVRLIGGGGSGASRGFIGTAVASGGAGGGYAEKILPVTAGQSFPVIVASGGLGVTGDANGNPGGTTSFGALVSATGGEGGIQSAGTTNTTIAVTENEGGTGIGGDINYIGGSSGAISNGNTSGNKICGVAGGGGSSATWMGNGVSSGDIVFNNINSNASSCASGGAGVGGNGGSIDPTKYTPSSQTNYDTSGGGAGSSGIDQSEGLDVWETSLLVLPNQFNARFITDIIFSAGGLRRTPGASIGVGGGSGGTAFGESTSPASVSRSGYFGGTGGFACTEIGYILKARAGGGGGGMVSQNINRFSGEGGSGLVIVEW